MATAPKVTIVSASDDRYAPMLSELIDSIRGHPGSAGIDVSVLATGMTPEVARDMAARADNFAEGTWPDENWRKRARGREWLLGRAVKLALPRYFPGYDIYVWIDADCWVADWRSVELLIEGARRGALAIAPDEASYTEIDGKFTWLFGRFPLIRTWSYKHARRAHLPLDQVRRLAVARPFNGGVFALKADAPHWQSATDHMSRLIQHARIFGSNQLALLMTTVLDGHPVEILPRWCNYFQLPKVSAETGCFVEPYLPHTPIGIMHLAGNDAMRLDRAVEVDLQDTLGRPLRRSLRYRPEYLVRR